jgi:putative two-component system response regulator
MFEILEETAPALILLDIDMPEMNGYEALKVLKSDARYSEIPVIFVTAKDDADSELEGFDLGAADYITKPFNPPLLIKRIEKELVFISQKEELFNAQAELRAYTENLEGIIQEKANRINHMQNSVLSTVVEMVEFRDKYTGGHVKRTQLYLKALLNEMILEGIYTEEISGWVIDSILQAAMLHDVGKIAVPDVILGKNAKLTEDEFDDMKVHVTAGVDVIEKVITDTKDDMFLTHAIRIAGTHHEKWDGSGYPMGLKGKNIPLEGRLMAVADVYDALISKRQYKDPLPHKKACAIIEEGAGTHFDPVLVDVFRSVKDEFDRIANEITY